MFTAAQLDQAIRHIASTMRTPKSQPEVVFYATKAIEQVKPLMQQLAEDGCRQFNLSMLLGQLEAISLDNTFSQNMYHWRDATHYLQSFMGEAAPVPSQHTFTGAEVQIMFQWFEFAQSESQYLPEGSTELAAKLRAICDQVAKLADQEEVDNLIQTWVELAKEELANGVPLGAAFEQHHEKIIDNATIRGYIKYDHHQIAEVKELFYKIFGRVTWASVVDHLRKGDN